MTQTARLLKRKKKRKEILVIPNHNYDKDLVVVADQNWLQPYPSHTIKIARMTITVSNCSKSSKVVLKRGTSDIKEKDNRLKLHFPRTIRQVSCQN